MKPCDRELSLGQRVGRSDSPGHAYRLVEALCGERPLALLQSPCAPKSVEVSHGPAVLAFGCQSFGICKMLFSQLSIPKPKPSVLPLRITGTVDPSRPITPHGIEEQPDAFC